MRNHGYFVYILASRRNGTLYCGVTNNLARRVSEHRDGQAEGFTRKYHVTQLVWFERHTDISEAILRENRIKNWNRTWKIALIEAENKEWRDLAEKLGLDPFPTVIPAQAGTRFYHGTSLGQSGSPLSRG